MEKELTMDDQSEMQYSPRQRAFLDKAIRTVKNHISDVEYNIEMFSRELGLSRSQLHRKLKTLTGLSASQFIRHQKLIKAVQLMELGLTSLSQVAKQSGFNSLSYFRKCFIKTYGVTPSRYFIIK
jgi:AraC-like DNA-binding protein